jgi:hypothetical protein
MYKLTQRASTQTKMLGVTIEFMHNTEKNYTPYHISRVYA